MHICKLLSFETGYHPFDPGDIVFMDEPGSLFAPIGPKNTWDWDWSNSSADAGCLRKWTWTVCSNAGPPSINPFTILTLFNRPLWFSILWRFKIRDLPVFFGELFAVRNRVFNIPFPRSLFFFMCEKSNFALLTNHTLLGITVLNTPKPYFNILNIKLTINYFFYFILLI